MKTRNFLILIATIAMLTIVMTSCSNEESELSNSVSNTYENQNNNDDTADEGVILSFRLLNEEGEETTVFKKGDNIVFDMVVVNNCDTTMVYTFEQWNDRVVRYGVCENGADMFLSSDGDFMCVFDEGGRRIGVPYSGMFCEYSMQTWMTVPSNSTSHLRCKWRETGKNDDVTYPICGCSGLEDLPIGHYCVSFSIKYRNRANDSESKFETIDFNYQFAVV